MALKDKVQLALDENRMLVLGTQVVMGVMFRIFFEPKFPHLTHLSQRMLLVGLFALATAFALLLTPSAFHRIVEDGHDTRSLLRFASGMMWPALLPFSLGLGTAFFVAGEQLLGRTSGWVLFGASIGLAVVLLHGVELVQRQRRRKVVDQMEAKSRQEPEKPAEPKDKIRQVLTEARLVIPGAQALLGFQFSIILMDAFDQLPESSKLLHLVSFGCIALAVVLLMAPAAYHRIAERGEFSEHIHTVSSAFVLAGTVPLSLGIAVDTFVVVRKVTHSASVAAWSAGLLLAFTWALWFGLTLIERRHHEHHPQLRRHPAHAR